jgi:4-hydroxy-2-oxoglutarate aldolase
MKKLLQQQFGYSDKPRRPLLPMSDEKAREMFLSPFLKNLLDAEALL